MCWSSMQYCKSLQVKKKGRYNRKCQEKRKTCQTGNGFLADEVSCLMYTGASWNFRAFMWQTKWRWWQKNMMTFESSNFAGLYEQQDIFYSANGNSELCKTFLTRIMFFLSCLKDNSDSAGPSVDILSQSEQEVARILGPEIFTGIPGGQDTMKLSNTSYWILSVLKKPH